MKANCGHDYEAQESGATGYATLGTAGTHNGRKLRKGAKICYACADAAERATLKTAERAFGYLSQDRQKITTWTGGELAVVRGIREHKRRMPRTGAPYTISYFRARDVHGAMWAGSSPGPGMYARMRRMKAGAPA